MQRAQNIKITQCRRKLPGHFEAELRTYGGGGLQLSIREYKMQHYIGVVRVVKGVFTSISKKHNSRRQSAIDRADCEAFRR
jgi:hypothetical protein